MTSVLPTIYDPYFDLDISVNDANPLYSTFYVYYCENLLKIGLTYMNLTSFFLLELIIIFFNSGLSNL